MTLPIRGFLERLTLRNHVHLLIEATTYWVGSLAGRDQLRPSDLFRLWPKTIRIMNSVVHH